LSGVLSVMPINQSHIFNLYITLITSKPHHIRFPKFTYVDEKFLGEFWGEVERLVQFNKSMLSTVTY